MGGISCCENPERKQQLIIDQIIAEDKLRVKSERKYHISIENLDQEKLKNLQRLLKGYLTRKKFFKYFELMKKLTIEELKYNTTEKDISYYVSDAVRDLENSGKCGNYEKTDYFFKNFKLCENNTFLIPFGALYVDKLHNNDIYQGTWNIEKKFHGYGILVKSDGSKYQGFWEHGLLVGEGRFYTATGDFFEGRFVNGVAQGFGVFIHNDGTTYKGDWLNDQPHGHGKEYFPDGSYFEGSFVLGKKNGQGTFCWTDGSTYVGNIENEIFQGTGKYTWADGRIYDGSWSSNQMNGKGLLIYSDGSFYEGEFMNNLRHGVGRYQWNENKYYEGTWQNGQQHGKGLYFKKGKLVEGIWHNGKLQNHKVISRLNNYELTSQRQKEKTDGYNVTISSFGESKDLVNGNAVIRGEAQNPHTMGITKTKSLKKFTT